MGQPAPIPRRSRHLGSAACSGGSDHGSHASTSAASSRSNRRQGNHNQFQTLKMFPDGHLEKLDDLGIANNTIVIYTTDNGAETFSWPDGGATPFRGEKNTNWEGGYRVPALIRWPGLVKPRTEINGIFSAEDWCPPWWLPPASRESRISCSPAIRPATRASRCISTAMTSATC